MKKNYYYEIGVMPTDNIEDGYSLYVKTEKELSGVEIDNLKYLVDNGFISEVDAKDSMYILPCSKEDYEKKIMKKKDYEKKKIMNGVSENEKNNLQQ